MGLELYCTLESPGGHIPTATESVGVGATREFVFLGSSQGMLLLIQAPHFMPLQ